MTVPFRFKGSRYTDNDEPARRRARAISQIGRQYSEGGAQTDIDSKPAEEAFNATKDYDLLRRVRRMKVSYPSPSKPK